MAVNAHAGNFRRYAVDAPCDASTMAPTRPDSTPSRSPTRTLPRSHRLGSSADFQRIYQTKTFVNLGPVVIHGAPNSLGHLRLGLSIPRGAGGAVIRNRIKRLFREAFRHLSAARAAGAPGYDLVVNIKPGRASSASPLTLETCGQMLSKALDQLHSRWTRRASHPDRTNADAETASPNRLRTSNAAKSGRPSRRPPRDRA